MARIRSVHPSLWTDDEFVSLSLTARLFLIGIWNEADDYGLLEWKPLRLKMRLAPADNIDAVAIMGELESAGFLVKFDRDGKPYGAIKNFRKFQKPQKPSPPIITLDDFIKKTICLQEERGYPVGLQEDSYIPPGNPNPMEKEKEEDREKDKNLASLDFARNEISGDGECELFPEKPQRAKPHKPEKPDGLDRFPEFYQAYPRHVARDDAEKAFRKALKAGASPDDLIAASLRFSAEKRGDPKFDPQYVPYPASWLNSGQWKDWLAQGPPEDQISEEAAKRLWEQRFEVRQ